MYHAAIPGVKLHRDVIIKTTMKRITLILLLLFLKYAQVCGAQTNDEGLAFLQFNFFNPGARALGMGGAFVGLADDASAALSNPAGTTILIRPEVSVEFSSTHFQNQIPWYSGGQTFRALEPSVDSIQLTDFQLTLQPKDFPSTANSLSFASYVYPFRPNRLVFSVLYNEQAKFGRDFATLGFKNCRIDDPICATPGKAVPELNSYGTLFDPTVNSMSLRIKNVGVSAGYKPWGKLSIGGTLSLSELEINSETHRNLPSQATHTVFILTGDNTKLSFTLGALMDFNRISIGSVYSSRPTFNAESRFIVDNNAAFQLPIDPIQKVKFNTPDSVALGISIKPTGPSSSLRINFDVARIFYSQLMDGYYNVRFNEPRILYNEQNNKPTDPLITKGYQHSTLELKDGTEIRTGAEYLFVIGRNPFAIRGGYWKEPFHTVTQTKNDADVTETRGFGDNPTNGFWLTDTREGPFWSRRFEDFHNPHHFTFGIGYQIRSHNLQIDAAYDYSKSFRRFIMSIDIFFGSI